ncbi:MAG TPA: 23S rRNA (pseudouridine(1915)-N(3))-methyltransferase RlmH [Bacteroidales bacterium]|nr:23S rRNA (pseudouridine(1915)-N(3))-methyltransferase RlmH [Bacteroidales bacterium]
MKIVLLQTGKTGEKYISEGVSEYSKRVRKYIAFEIITIPDIRNTKSMPVAEQKSREGRQILGQVSGDDLVFLLDERGREYSTTAFASMMEKSFNMSKKRIVFVIGGPWGFSDEVYARADRKISLSQLTFSHQMVRLLFAEQLYRILSVINGAPYHHD